MSYKESEIKCDWCSKVIYDEEDVACRKCYEILEKENAELREKLTIDSQQSL